ncbi:MAG: glycosyltransferase, partial [Gammaproteobacteria bacterium]
MGRILMTWELGRGLGHLVPLISLASGLRSQGHHVELAVRDPVAAGPLLQSTGITFHAAPIPPIAASGQPLASYPQILRQVGFDKLPALRGRLHAWQALFDAARPELLICDHSPTALLAARATGLKAIVTGTGFTVPPDIAPLPDLRPWSPADPAQLIQDEAHVLGHMNAVLKKSRAPQLERLAQLFLGNAQVLFTLRELDNYAEWRQA